MEGNSIRRVRQNQVCLLASHELFNVLCPSGIAAHQAVLTNRPDIALLYKGCLFQCCRQVKVIILNLRFFITEEICDFLIIKAGQRYIEGFCLQCLNLNSQQLLIPASVHGHSVVSQDIGFLLSLCQVVHKYTRHLINALLTGS